MFLPRTTAKDQTEDRNAAKPQLKKALSRRIVVSAYRRKSRAYGPLTYFAVPNSSR
jgi:hypothetical protein